MVSSMLYYRKVQDLLEYAYILIIYVWHVAEFTELYGILALLVLYLVIF